jgi:hypothetical protein
MVLVEDMASPMNRKPEQRKKEGNLCSGGIG